MVDDPPFVGHVVLRPPSPLSPTSGRLASPVRFDLLGKLVAAEVSREEDQMNVTLWWKAERETPIDYTVLVHVLDENGQLIAQQDAPPNSNLSPTSLWQSGDVIRDRHSIPLPAEAGSAELRLLVGLYDRFTGQRLIASQDGRPLPNNTVALPVQEE
jgi:hypothetical protein